MVVRRFRNGDLLVPTGGEDENGILWDGRRRLRKGTREHAQYEAELRRSRYDVPTMSEEEDRMATAEAGEDYIEAAERSLREFGADFSDGTPPDQVMVWKPAQVRKAEQNLRDRDWLDGVVHFGSCSLTPAPAIEEPSTKPVEAPSSGSTTSAGTPVGARGSRSHSWRRASTGRLLRRCHAIAYATMPHLPAFSPGGRPKWV